MNNRAKKLLFDVLDSGLSIRQWCSGRSFADYEEDRQFRRAVEREFEIIGEALNRLPQTDPHGYDAIDDAAVWGVTESYLPHLISELESLLKEDGEPSDSDETP